MLQKVVVVGGLRIPFVKSFAQYSGSTNQEMLTACLKTLVNKFNLSGKRLGDVVMGSVIKHSGDWNFIDKIHIKLKESA